MHHVIAALASAHRVLSAAAPTTPQLVMSVLRAAGLPLTKHGSKKRREGVERGGLNVVKMGSMVAIQYEDSTASGVLYDEKTATRLLTEAVSALLASGLKVKSPATDRVLSGSDEITAADLKNGMMLVAR